MSSVRVLALAAAFVATASGAEDYVTAAGIALRLPAVQALDCPEMRAKLDEIDASGYRDGSPLPKNEADMALLDYENRLSGAYYIRCLRMDARANAPDSAFSQGFAPIGNE
jgi:hypothetical protein